MAWPPATGPLHTLSLCQDPRSLHSTANSPWTVVHISRMCLTQGCPTQPSLTTCPITALVVLPASPPWSWSKFKLYFYLCNLPVNVWLSLQTVTPWEGKLESAALYVILSLHLPCWTEMICLFICLIPWSMSFLRVVSRSFSNTELSSVTTWWIELKDWDLIEQCNLEKGTWKFRTLDGASPQILAQNHPLWKSGVMFERRLVFLKSQVHL